MSNIIPLLRNTLLLVGREVEGLIHKDLYLVRLRKLPDKFRASLYIRSNIFDLRILLLNTCFDKHMLKTNRISKIYIPRTAEERSRNG